MVTLESGTVVLVPFPFSDLSETKLRPAIILAAVDRGDWILCQVTSNPYGDRQAVELRADAFASGNLRLTSYARPGKLFTAHTSLFRGQAGRLTADTTKLIRASVRALFE